MTKKTTNSVRKSIDKSAFFNLASRRKLARLLFISESQLRVLSSQGDSLYRVWSIPKKSGGSRQIEAPRADLKKVQSRIAQLLGRIEPPPFLMAPVKGRSYIDNAFLHREGEAFRLLDIEDFFPNCREQRVFWFFNKKMRCSSDVASILATLLTKGGRLPQGSPASPIVAFYSYINMWEEIDLAVRTANCKLSVYIDDITISGMNVPEKLVWTIKYTLKKYAHSYKKAKERSSIHRPIEVTGVIIDPGRRSIALPNRQHKNIHDLRKELRTIRSPTLLKIAESKLRGRLAQADQVLRKQREEESLLEFHNL